jgi:DNA-binding GntR family transcriptional regulator
MALIDQIRTTILSGQHRPGTILSQTELAATYGVSRIPVRDALQLLAGEKLVEILPGKGARIVKLSPEDLNEIYDLRITLETDLLTRAICRADDQAHTDIDYALRKSSLEAGRPGWHVGDWDFHRALYLPAGRPRQLSIIEELRTSCVLYASGYEALASETERWLEEHRALAKAYIEGHANDACEILKTHILAAKHRLTDD